MKGWIAQYPKTTVSTYVYQKGERVEKSETIFYPIELEMRGKRYGLLKTDQKMIDPTERPGRTFVRYDKPIERLIKIEDRTKFIYGHGYATFPEKVTVREEMGTTQTMLDALYEFHEDRISLEDLQKALHNDELTCEMVPSVYAALQDRSALLLSVYHDRGDVYMEAATDLPFPPFNGETAWTHYEPEYMSRAVPERTIWLVIDTETGACLGSVTKKSHADKLIEMYASATELGRDTETITYQHAHGKTVCKRYDVEEMNNV